MKKIPSTFPSYAHNRRDAFSLIEVVLAIGVMAIAVIPLMALLPNGLSSYRAASDSMTQTAVMRYVSGLMASKAPGSWQTNDIYFTDEMTFLTNNNASNAAYRVSFSSLTNSAPSFNNENLPGDSANPTTKLERLWRVSYVIWDARANRIIGTNGFELADRDKSTN